MSRKKKLSTGLPVKPLVGPQIEEKLISDIKEQGLIPYIADLMVILLKFSLPDYQ